MILTLDFVGWASESSHRDGAIPMGYTRRKRPWEIGDERKW